MITGQRKLLYDRVRLIRGMQSFLDTKHQSLSSVEYVTILGIIQNIRQDTDSFLSYSQEEEGYVSYAQKPEHKYDTQKRYRTKLGRYLRRNLGIVQERLSDKTIEMMSYNVIGYISNNGNGHIRVIQGDDIVEAYRDGVGGDTCMSRSCAKYTEVYAMSSNVSMVIYRNRARAILWTCDDGTVVLDRIYPNSGSHIGIIEKWAKDQGYVYRRNHGGCCDGLSDDDTHVVTLKMNQYFPYMDTFKAGQLLGDNMISISNDPYHGNLDLEQTRGYLEGEHECCNCGDNIPEGDGCESDDGDTYCEDCYDETFTGCVGCNNEIRNNDACQANGNAYCEDCFGDKFTRCAHCGDVVDLDEVHDIEGDLFCEDCYNTRKEDNKEQEEEPVPVLPGQMPLVVEM